MGERIQFPEPKEGQKPTGVGRKVRALVLERLKGNEEAGIVGRLQEVSCSQSHRAANGLRVRKRALRRDGYRRDG